MSSVQVHFSLATVSVYLYLFFKRSQADTHAVLERLSGYNCIEVTGSAERAAMQSSEGTIYWPSRLFSSALTTQACMAGLQSDYECPSVYFIVFIHHIFLTCK